MSLLFDSVFLDVIVIFLLISACLVLIPAVYYLYKEFLKDLRNKKGVE